MLCHVLFKIQPYFIVGLEPFHIGCDALIPVLYLKGISTGDFTEALEAILGPNAAGLSATNIVRLKEGWKKETQEIIMRYL